MARPAGMRGYTQRYVSSKYRSRTRYSGLLALCAYMNSSSGRSNAANLSCSFLFGLVKHWPQCSDLIVGVHHRNKDGARRYCTPDIFGSDSAEVIDRKVGHGRSEPLKKTARVKNGRVFDLSGDDVAAAPALSEECAVEHPTHSLHALEHTTGMLLERARVSNPNAALHAAKVNANSPTAVRVSPKACWVAHASVRFPRGLGLRHIDEKELRLLVTHDRDCKQHERRSCLVD